MRVIGSRERQPVTCFPGEVTFDSFIPGWDEALVNHVTPNARWRTGQEMGQHRARRVSRPPGLKKNVVATVTGPLDPVRLWSENQGA